MNKGVLATAKKKNSKFFIILGFKWGTGRNPIIRRYTWTNDNATMKEKGYGVICADVTPMHLYYNQ